MSDKTLGRQETVSRIHSGWANLVSRSHCLYDDKFRLEALGFAMRLMQGFRDFLLKLIDRLDAEEYEFVAKDVYRDPDINAADWIEELRRKSIFLPISLEACIKTIGYTNLMGTHPSWRVPAYKYEYDKHFEEPIYTDPFVFEVTHEYIEYLYSEWCSGDTPERDPIFKIDISPDYIHKANISGGMPYQIAADKQRVDSLFLNERHCTTLFGYIYRTAYWRGFPGFDYFKKSDCNWESEDYLII